MPIIDCTCTGINPNCEKCFGRGYYDTEKNEESRIIFKPEKGSDSLPSDDNKSLSDIVKELNPDDLKELSNRITNSIDNISNEQLKILNTISFGKRKFYKDSKVKFSKLDFWEKEKEFLKRDLDIILNRAQYLDLPLQITFKHIFSENSININSVNELKKLKRKLAKIRTRKKTRK